MLIQQEWEQILNSIERIAKLSLQGTRVEPRRDRVLCVVFFDNLNYNMCKTVHALEQVERFAREHYGRELTFESRLAVTNEQAPAYVSDEDLSVFHTEIEIEED